MTSDTLVEPRTAEQGGTPTNFSGSNPRPVRRAIILAAGRGSRLQPFTVNLPKCLVEIGGESLLKRALRGLASQGITQVVIVVGYESEVVRERIGNSFSGVDVVYVEAPDYATTNNIRSLWDARRYLDQDILLLEADVAFDPEVIAALLKESGSAAAVAPYKRTLSGTVVRRDSRGQVTSFILGAEQGRKFDTAGTFKTVNIYLLREELLREEVVPRLCRAIKAGRMQDYYEGILRDCVADGDSVIDLTAVDISASRWCEIDDERDLDTAEFLFLDRQAQFDRIQNLSYAGMLVGVLQS